MSQHRQRPPDRAGSELRLTLVARPRSEWRGLRSALLVLISAGLFEQAEGGGGCFDIEVRASGSEVLLGTIDAGSDERVAHATLELFEQRAVELSTQDFLARYQLTPLPG